jgi:hypothetical protein
MHLCDECITVTQFPLWWLAGMVAAIYRAFLIDATDHVFAVRALNSTDDAAALHLGAQIQAACRLIEVWYGTQMVGTVEPMNKTP